MGSREVVVVAKCRCCGIWEECTAGYIHSVEEKFGGVWVCGLCEEAIKDEQVRLGVGVETALQVHASFRETVSVDPIIRFAHSLLQLLKKKIIPISTS
ncbi:hypothetical protein DsansV1_C02g0017411 [Dioscorea sansibarensis]